MNLTALKQALEEIIVENQRAGELTIEEEGEILLQVRKA